MKKLLTLTVIFEGTTGIALLIAPSFVVSLLLGAALSEPAGIFVSRLTGVALITLSVICWLYRENDGSGVIKAMLFYNIAAAALLVVAAVSGSSGIGIWPASLLHAGLAAWCIKYLLK